MTIRIRNKIIFCFVVVVLLVSFLGGITLHSRSLLIEKIKNLEKEIAVLGIIAEIQLDIERVAMPPNDFLITGAEVEKKNFNGLFFKALNSLKRLDKLAIDPKQHELYTYTLDSLFIFKEKADLIFELPSPVGNKEGARLMEVLDSVAAAIIVDYLGEYYRFENMKVSELVLSAELARDRVNRMLIIGAIVSIITLVLLILYLSRTILRPIAMFTQGASIIGSGNLEHRIDLRDGLEMNMLADEFNSMAGRLQKSYFELEGKVRDRTKELSDANTKLEKLAITDGLTGAFNQKQFYKVLAEELERAGRYGRTLSVIIMDIDNFKNFNDTHGHVEGDAVLKNASALIKSKVRKQDMVSRYGGEEFTVLLPETEKEHAVLLAERLRSAMHDKEFPGEELQPGGRLTISLGVATFPDDEKEAKALVEKADQALYRAKDGGRDRVEQAEALSA